MGLAGLIKQNSRQISDSLAGSPDYYDLATTNLSLYRAVHAAAERHARGRLLDAGAGRMAYRPFLKNFCEKYESLDHADVPTAVDIRADLQQTALPDSQYDTIVCTQVLQHLPEPGKAVSEIARLLKPGGKAIFTVPHMVWLHNEPHDYFRFTHYAMRHLLEKAGLEVIEEEKLGGLICFLAYPQSTLTLALLWPVRPLFRLGLLANKLFIRIALWQDKFLGLRSLYPVNFLVVARKK